MIAYLFFYQTTRESNRVLADPVVFDFSRNRVGSDLFKGYLIESFGWFRIPSFMV
jgi:hypothetical protein